MKYEPTKPQPPWDCTCGCKFPELRFLDRHLRAFRREAARLGITNIHKKVRGVSYADAAAKGGETQRRRRMNFVEGS